jgi:hypothetical protein
MSAVLSVLGIMSPLLIRILLLRLIRLKLKLRLRLRLRLRLALILLFVVVVLVQVGGVSGGDQDLVCNGDVDCRV